MTNIFKDAQPGDEFACRNGESRWFIGRTRNGKILVEDAEGQTALRYADGRLFSDCSCDADIIRRKESPITKWLVLPPNSGYSTLERAKTARNQTWPDATIVRVTFTPGEDQE